MARILLLSTTGIYLLNKEECRRALKIAEIKYLIRSETSPEMMIYFRDETDLRLRIYEEEDKMQAFMTLVAKFTQVNPYTHLKLFGVPEEDLKKYRPQSSDYAFDVEPAEKYRLKDEEVQTESEYRESKVSKPTDASTDIDFDPESRSSIKLTDKMSGPQSQVAPDNQIEGDEDLLFKMNSTEFDDNITDHFKNMLENQKTG